MVEIIFLFIAVTVLLITLIKLFYHAFVVANEFKHFGGFSEGFSFRYEDQNKHKPNRY